MIEDIVMLFIPSLLLFLFALFIFSYAIVEGFTGVGLFEYNDLVQCSNCKGIHRWYERLDKRCCPFCGRDARFYGINETWDTRWLIKKRWLLQKLRHAFRVRREKAEQYRQGIQNDLRRSVRMREERKNMGYAQYYYSEREGLYKFKIEDDWITVSKDELKK